MSRDELYLFMINILYKVPNNNISDISSILFGFELSDADDIIYLLEHRNKQHQNVI